MEIIPLKEQITYDIKPYKQLVHYVPPELLVSVLPLIFNKYSRRKMLSNLRKDSKRTESRTKAIELLEITSELIPFIKRIVGKKRLYNIKNKEELLNLYSKIIDIVGENGFSSDVDIDTILNKTKNDYNKAIKIVINRISKNSLRRIIRIMAILEELKLKLSEIKTDFVNVNNYKLLYDNKLLKIRDEEGKQINPFHKNFQQQVGSISKQKLEPVTVKWTQHPIYGKYFRLLRSGVPLQHVKKGFINDGNPESDLVLLTQMNPTSYVIITKDLADLVNKEQRRTEFPKMLFS